MMSFSAAHNAHPISAVVLNALVAFHRDTGNQAAARSYAEKLRMLSD
jgi:hypothetical protein